MNLIRRSVAVGVIGALSLVVGGLGVATAANGGSLRLGASNHATKTTKLTDRRGTPLSLVGKKSKAPLKVNSSKEVTHLNAALVGGKSAATLESSGSAGQYRHTGISIFTGNPLSTSIAAPTEIAQTASLAAGTYYVAASTETDYQGGSGTANLACAIAPVLHPVEQLATAVNTTAGYSTENENTVVTVTTPEALGEFCYASSSQSAYYEGDITAIHIAHTVAGHAPTG